MEGFRGGTRFRVAFPRLACDWLANADAAVLWREPKDLSLLGFKEMH